jgi:hypothetical protein
MQAHVRSRRKWLNLAVVSALSWQPLTSIAADSADA